MSLRPLHPRVVRTAAWFGLFAASLGAAAALRMLHVPAAMLLGPMLVGLGTALCGTSLRLPRATLLVVQAVFGCLVAAAVDADLLAALRQHGLLLAACGAASIVLSALIGLALARAGWIPGSTAIWGCAPGAAATMVLLSQAHGGDPRIVAMMQYLRIIVVTLAVVGLATVLGEPKGLASQATASVHGTAPNWQGMAVAALLVVGGTLAAVRLRAASVALLLPSLAGGVLQAGGWVQVVLPREVAALAFGLAGCAVGLRFDRAVLLQCWRKFPAMALGVAAVIVGCGLLSWLLLHLAPGTGVLTAWLALTPGGLDTAVAIAASVQVSLPLVIAAQLLRLGIVTVTGPVVARWLSRGWGAQARKDRP